MAVPATWRARMADLTVSLVAIAAIAIAVLNMPRVSARFDRPDPESQIAAILRADPEASVWVVNQEPIIYFLAGLPLPTPYVFPPHLVSDYSALIRTDPEIEIRRVLNNRPRYLVVDPSPDKERWILPHLRQIISQRIGTSYELYCTFPGRFGPVSLYRLHE